MKPVTTTEGLREAARAALKMAYAELAESKGCGPIILLCEKSGTIQKLPVPKEARGIMNDGKAKDILFGYLRITLNAMPDVYAGAVIVTEMWHGTLTRKGELLGPEQHAKLSGRMGLREMERLGYVELRECVTATAQNPETVLMLSHSFRRDDDSKVILDEEPVEQITPQDGFVGRLKLYGEARVEPWRKAN